MNYTQEVELMTSPQKLFKAITRELPLWWGKTDVPITKIDEEFTISFGNAFWTFKILEFVPNEKLTWECVDGQPELEHEWVGTTLYWVIEKFEDGSQLKFTHDGLTPAFDCYDVCAPAWDMFLTSSLKSFVETGRGTPH